MSNLATEVRRKYPIWDADAKKFKNHYCNEELINVLNLIQTLDLELHASEGEQVRIPEIRVARVITKMRNPPTPVMTWTLRVLRIYYHKPLLKAVKEGKVSARYALSDLANRVGDRRFEDLLEEACRGNVSNAEFRRQSVKLNKG